MTDQTTADLRDLYAQAIRDNVRLRLGTNALRLAEEGRPVMLNYSEAEAAADAVLGVQAAVIDTASDTAQHLADLRSRALDRAHALAEQWQGDQTPITRAHAAELLMEVIQLHGWTQTTAAPGRHLTPVADNDAQPGLRGLLEHVGIDTTGRNITVDGKVVDAARQAGGQQPDTETVVACVECELGTAHTVHCPSPETHNWGCGCPTDERPAAARCPDWPECNHPFALDGCTCRPWTRQTTPARYLEPGDSIEMISGWERGADCPHHAPAPAAGPDDTQTTTGTEPARIRIINHPGVLATADTQIATLLDAYAAEVRAAVLREAAEIAHSMGLDDYPAASIADRLRRMADEETPR